MKSKALAAVLIAVVVGLIIVAIAAVRSTVQVERAKAVKIDPAVLRRELLKMQRPLLDSRLEAGDRRTA